MLQQVQDKLSQEVNEFAADSHNLEIQKCLQQLVNNVKQNHSSHHKLDMWKAICYIIDGESQPRFYHEHGPKSQPSQLKKQKKKNKKVCIYAQRPRKNVSSQYLIDNINHFGACGGFDHIFQSLTHTDVSMDEVLLFIRLLHGVRLFLTPELNQQIMKHSDFIFNKFINLQGQSLKNTPEDRLKIGISQFYSLYSQFSSSHQQKIKLEKFRFDVCTNFLSSPFLNKEVLGLNMLIELLEQADQQSGALDSVLLSNWINSRELVQSILGKPSLHYEIAQRSVSLIQFLLKHDQLRPNHVELIWKIAISGHHSSTTEHIDAMIKLIFDCSSPQKLRALRILDDLSLHNVKTEYLDLIHYLAKSILLKEPPNHPDPVDGVKFLWNCVCHEDVPFKIRKHSINLLSNIMQEPHGRKCRRHYLIECTRMIISGSSTSFVHALLSFLQTFNNKVTSKSYANRTTHSLRDESELSQILDELNSIGLVAALVKQILDSFKADNLNVDAITTRLDTLTFACNSPNISLDFPQINNILSLLMTPPSSLHQPLVNWLIGVASSLKSAKTSILKKQTAQDFYNQTLGNLNPVTLTFSLYQVFEKFFVQINGLYGNFAHYESGPENVVVKKFVNRNGQLLWSGFQQLWSAALQCQNFVVARRAIQVIVQLHKQIAQSLQGESRQIRDRLIEGCYHQLASNSNKIMRRRALLILREFICAFKPSKEIPANVEDRDINCNLLIKSHTNQPIKLHLQVNTLMRVGELRSQIASEHKFKRDQIQLHINSSLADDDSLRFCQFFKRNRTDPVEINAGYSTKERKRDKNTPAMIINQNGKVYFKMIYDVMHDVDIVSASLAYDIVCVTQPPGIVTGFLTRDWRRLFANKVSPLQILYLLEVLWDILQPRKAVFQVSHDDVTVEHILDHYRRQEGFTFLFNVFMDKQGWEKPSTPYDRLIRNKVILQIMRILNLKIPHPDKPEKMITILKHVTPSNQREATFIRLFDVICNATKSLPPVRHNVVQSTSMLNVLQTVHQAINEAFKMTTELLNWQPSLMSCFEKPHLDKQVEMLIMECLLNSENQYIQRAVKLGIRRICNSFRADHTLHPSEYFRTKLTAALDQIQSFKSNGEYFELMRSLFEKSSKSSATPPMEQVHDLIERLTGLIINHSPERTEKAEDNTLIGLLGLTQILVEVMNREKAKIKNNVAVSLANDLFTSCLFQIGQDDRNLSQDVWQVKCKTPESRDAAFGLLEAITKNCEQSLQQLLVLLDQFLALEGDEFWWKADPTRQMKVAPYVGLRNLGNTCYLNCIIQQLFGLHAFSNTVLQLTEKSDDFESSCFYELQRVFQVLSSSHKKFHDPYQFVSKLKDGNGQPIDVSVQTDLHEFLMSIFTQLDERLKHTENPKLVSELFEGKQLVELVTEQGNQTTRVQTFTHIQVHVKECHSLEEGLNALCKEEIIPDYRCGVTGETVAARQTSSFSDLPPVLIFCLSRFDYSVEHVRSVKLNHFVSFPEDLNMSAYRPKGEKFRRRNQLDKNKDDEYKLVGVVIHKGEPNRGHYYSFIKTDVQNDEWYRFDDEKVSPFNGENLRDEAFGGEEERILHNGRDLNVDKERNAYLLFYVRSSMLNEVKASSGLQSSQIAPYLEKNIDSFRQENLRLFRDASIVDARFHKFAESILKSNFNNPSTSKVLTSVCLRFVFNVICKLNRTAKDLKPWFKLLREIFQNPKHCSWLLGTLSQNHYSRWISELLISTPQMSVRAKVGEFLADICKCFCDNLQRGDPTRDNSVHSVLDSFLLCLLNSLPYWRSGEQVFDLLVAITKPYEQTKRTLIKAGAIGQLSTCLRQVSSSIYEGQKIFPSRKRGVNVNQIVVILDSLLRICRLTEKTGARSPFLKVDPSQAMHLQHKDMALLNSYEFYSFLLAKDCKLDPVVSICSHLSFENNQRFQIIQKIVLDRLKWLDFDEFYLGLSVLLNMLRIKDSFQKQRLQSVLYEVCNTMMEQQFYWKATDVSVFCLLRASRKNDDIATWLINHMNEPVVEWMDGWLLKKPPKNDAETQTMFKSSSFSTNPDEATKAIDAKRKRGDNLNNWKRLQKGK